MIDGFHYYHNYNYYYYSLHKNATCNVERVPGGKRPTKAVDVRPFTTHHENYQS